MNDKLFKLVIVASFGGDIDFWPFINSIARQTGILKRDFPDNWNLDKSNFRWIVRDPFHNYFHSKLYYDEKKVIDLVRYEFGQEYLNNTQYHIRVLQFQLPHFGQGYLCLIRDYSLVLEHLYIPYDYVTFGYITKDVTSNKETELYKSLTLFETKHKIFLSKDSSFPLKLAEDHRLTFSLSDCFVDDDVDYVHSEIKQIFDNYNINFEVFLPKKCSVCGCIKQSSYCLRCAKNLILKKRQEEIVEEQEKRKLKGLCYLCGEPLGFILKLQGLRKHKYCEKFTPPFGWKNLEYL